MSLPTYCNFYDINDKLLASHYVNVGWWLDVDNIAEAVVNLPRVVNVEYAMLYDIRIPKELLIEPPKDITWKVQREMIREFVEIGVKLFYKENEELYNSIKKLYLKELRGE